MARLIKNPPYVNLMRPDRLHPEDIRIEDIAHNLARINRFCGALQYSVAEHSVLASDMVWRLYSKDDKEKLSALRLQALLHDAHEAYLGDIVTPVMDWLGDEARERMNMLKAHVDYQIAEALNFLQDPSSDIKAIDKQLLDFELAFFFRLALPVTHSYDLVKKEFQCWNPDEAEERFLHVYNELKGMMI